MSGESFTYPLFDSGTGTLMLPWWAAAAVAAVLVVLVVLAMVRGKPFHQLKNYVWSQLSQITLYEILVREGKEAANKTLARLVAA